MRQCQAVLLLVLLLTACTSGTAVSPTPVAPPTAAATQAPAPTAAPAPTDLPTAPAPTAEPTSTPAVVEPLPTEASAEQPTEESSIQPTREPVPTLTPSPAGRILSVENPPLEGEDVYAVQNRLIALGYTQGGAVDNVYGPKTAEAVRAFQTRNSLESDGVVGPQTWGRLMGFEPVPAEGAGELIPIVDTDGVWLLGATRDGWWIEAMAAANLLPAQPYLLYLPDGSVAEITGGQPGGYGVPCEYTVGVNLNPQPERGIAVGRAIDARPRPVTTGEPNNPMAIDAVAGILRDNGLPDSQVIIKHILSADLDDDGVEELVVSATRLQLTELDTPTPDAAAGDYSLVVLLRPNAKPTVLIGQYHTQDEEFTAPEVFNVIDLLDLNGDGRMEMIISSEYYEGAATSVFELSGDGVEEVLLTGCGV